MTKSETETITRVYGETSTFTPYPDPTPEMLESPAFEAVWQCIKGWDISTHASADGHRLYSGATGTHVRAILDALAHVAA